MGGGTAFGAEMCVNEDHVARHNYEDCVWRRQHETETDCDGRFSRCQNGPCIAPFECSICSRPSPTSRRLAVSSRYLLETLQHHTRSYRGLTCFSSSSGCTGWRQSLSSHQHRLHEAPRGSKALLPQRHLCLIDASCSCHIRSP